MERDEAVAEIKERIESAIKQIGDRELALTNREREHNRIAGDLAAQVAEFERQREDLRARFNLIVSMVGPLVTKLELGPMDRVVSVAIEGADGEIRLVKL